VKTFLTSATLLAFGLAGVSTAQTDVVADIVSNTNWTLAGSPYNLTKQIYVKNNAALTIDAGVQIINDHTLKGSLAVTRGSKIFVNGTASNPVVMTSDRDDFQTWQELANEWGNLTLMGNAYISEDDPSLVPPNSPVPAATNRANMEGLNAGAATDQYGGGDDDDDSGTISYLSLRYGGKVIGLGNELNGLSLGGIGRGTDIHHVEVMNNVDDGVEIFGGTVNLKYMSIWNVGDDSFDVDQGWRGKCQFAFIVQGYSIDTNQGGGVGDNCFETDGAENSDYQPVTTATIYNATVIGQPLAGDHGTAWRDNARVQYRKCIFMDLGEELIQFDNIDGDGGLGYGHNGTLDWPTTWTTAFNVYSLVNAPAAPAPFYQAQVDGNLAELTDSVFFRNQFNPAAGDKAYTEATALGVLPGNGVNNNVQIASTLDADSPIAMLTRDPIVVKGGKAMVPVCRIDPRPANEALFCASPAPNDGFFTQATYRGAFEPSNPTWLDGWSAAWSYGFLATADTSAESYCTAGTSADGCTPSLSTAGVASASAPSGFVVTASAVPGQKDGLFFFGTNGRQANPWGNGTSFQCVVPPVKRGGLLNGNGTSGVCDAALTQDFNALWATKPSKNPGAGALVQLQGWYRDPLNTSNQTTSLTDAIEFCVDL